MNLFWSVWSLLGIVMCAVVLVTDKPGPVDLLMIVFLVFNIIKFLTSLKEYLRS
jgi:hypothetical protein